MPVLPPTEESTAARSVVGHLNDLDPPHIGCGREARQIADYAAAQRHDGIGAAHQVFGQKIEQRDVGVGIFRCFAVRKHKGMHRVSVLLKLLF